jgi:hypothetical protein
MLNPSTDHRPAPVAAIVTKTPRNAPDVNAVSALPIRLLSAFQPIFVSQTAAGSGKCAAAHGRSRCPARRRAAIRTHVHPLGRQLLTAARPLQHYEDPVAAGVAARVRSLRRWHSGQPRFHETVACRAPGNQLAHRWADTCARGVVTFGSWQQMIAGVNRGTGRGTAYPQNCA